MEVKYKMDQIIDKQVIYISEIRGYGNSDVPKEIFEKINRDLMDAQGLKEEEYVIIDNPF